MSVFKYQKVFYIISKTKPVRFISGPYQEREEAKYQLPSIRHKLDERDIQVGIEVYETSEALRVQTML
jgi:hypothetical protein